MARPGRRFPQPLEKVARLDDQVHEGALGRRLQEGAVFRRRHAQVAVDAPVQELDFERMAGGVVADGFEAGGLDTVAAHITRYRGTPGLRF
jgi:hypothetical protein